MPKRMRINQASEDVRLALAVSASFHCLAFGILWSWLAPALPASPTRLSKADPAGPSGFIQVTLEMPQRAPRWAAPADGSLGEDGVALRQPPQSPAPTVIPPGVLPSPIPVADVAPARPTPANTQVLLDPPFLTQAGFLSETLHVEPAGAAPPAASPEGVFAQGLGPPAAGERSSGPSVAPGYRSAPPPPYPAEARRRRQEGVVLLAVAVNERGTALSVDVKASSGHPLLDRAAIDTVSQWQFLPARIGGRAVAAVAEVPIRFSLSGSSVF
jgi:protein TonB